VLAVAGIGLKFLESSADAPTLGLLSGLLLLVSLPALVLGACGREAAR
jgi:hypothetical protein